MKLSEPQTKQQQNIVPTFKARARSGGKPKKKSQENKTEQQGTQEEEEEDSLPPHAASVSFIGK
jgi:hypothetical protein